MVHAVPAIVQRASTRLTLSAHRCCADTLSVLAKALAVDVHVLLVSASRESGAGSVYRIGRHDIEVVRDAVRTAESLGSLQAEANAAAASQDRRAATLQPFTA